MWGVVSSEDWDRVWDRALVWLDAGGFEVNVGPFSLPVGRLLAVLGFDLLGSVVEVVGDLEFSLPLEGLQRLQEAFDAWFFQQTVRLVLVLLNFSCDFCNFSSL